MFSFGYVIDPQVSKTEEDTHEQCSWRCQEDKAQTGFHEKDGGVPPEDSKVAALVCYNASTWLIDGNMWLNTNKLWMELNWLIVSLVCTLKTHLKKMARRITLIFLNSIVSSGK